MNDQKILSQLYAHTDTALQLLADTYGGRLYTTAHNILGDHQDAEECLNDTYLALWNAIPPKRPEPLIAYACRVIRNIALNRRREKPSGYDLPLDELAGCLPDPSMEETLGARALGRSINAFLATVSPRDRRIFVARYWFGDSVKEIAAAWKMTENAVSVCLSRTRDKLKAYLIKEGYYEA